MRNVFKVAYKEIKTFFQTPIGYVILCVFTGFAGWFFFYSDRFFPRSEASLRVLFFRLPILFLVFAPAITMRLWAEERKSGTFELLMTLPLKDWELVLGKFFAAMGVIAVWLFCLLPIVAVVAWFGEPDSGPIWGGFLGALLLGGAFASIGLAVSAFTENQIIAFVVSVALCFLFCMADYDAIVAIFPEFAQRFVHNISLSTHFEPITRGIVDSRDIVFYLSFIAFFLFINLWALRRQKQAAIRIALVGGILLVVNYMYMGSSYFVRADLTEEKRHTLSEGTINLLKDLDDDLVITAFLSADLPTEFTNLRRDIEDLMHEFQSYSGERMRVEILEPDKSEDAKKLAEQENIRAIEVTAASVEKLESRMAWLGCVIESGDKKEILPTIGNTEGLEYELDLRIAKVTRKEEAKVAFQVDDPFGGMNIPGMQMPPRGGNDHSPHNDMKVLNEVFGSQFKTETVDLKSAVNPEIKTIIVANGNKLTDQQKFHLDQFLMNGGSVVLLASGTETSEMGQSMGMGANPYMRSPAQSTADDFYSHYGFTINKDLILDASCVTMGKTVDIGGGIRMRVPVQAQFIPSVLAESIDQNHPMSHGFRELLFPFVSSLTLAPKPGVKATELVKSSPKAKKKDGQFIMVNPDTPEDPATFNEQYTFVALLEGEFHSFFNAREIPKEVIEEKTGVKDEHELDEGLIENLGGDPKDGSKDDEKDASSASPATQDSETPSSDDGTAHAKEKSDDGGFDVPGGGWSALPQDPPVPELTQEAPKPAPTIEFLKKSPANTKFLVIGSTEMGLDSFAGQVQTNLIFLMNAVDFLTSEHDLSSVRAKRIDDRPFPEPKEVPRKMGLLFGVYTMPLLMVVLGVFVHFWRRVLRPSRARRMMSAAASAGA